MTNLSKTLTPLLPALAARRDRDAQSLAEIRTQIADLDADRARIETSIIAGAAQIDAADLSARAVFDQWREAQRARLRALAERRRTLEAEDNARREVLLQSNGEVRAAETLLDRAAEQARAEAETKSRRRAATPEPRPRDGGDTKASPQLDQCEDKIPQTRKEV
ncbi:MAG: hypothetical protein KTR21_09055 [Rhodobacteraceae bacterium]|nr:hypothetical protein [Paracoccaceae bacterium]